MPENYFKTARRSLVRNKSYTVLNVLGLAVGMAIFLLIGLGGLVTSHEAGLAVPDWPTTYGYNMFLFPVRLWENNIFYEHTHRLFASSAGLLTTILALWVWLQRSRSAASEPARRLAPAPLDPAGDGRRLREQPGCVRGVVSPATLRRPPRCRRPQWSGGHRGAPGRPS